MRQLCFELSRCENSIPAYIKPISVGKIVSLLYAKQCNNALFLDLLGNMKGVLEMLPLPTSSSSSSSSISSSSSGQQYMQYNDDINTSQFSSIIPHLEALVSDETGVNLNRSLLSQGNRCDSSAYHAKYYI